MALTSSIKPCWFGAGGLDEAPAPWLEGHSGYSTIRAQ